MKKREVLVLSYVITESLKLAKGAKFCYALMKNENILKPEIECLKKIEDGYREGIKAFDEDRNALIVKLGKPKPDGMIQVEEDDMAKFKKEVEKLEKKHESSLEAFNTSMTEYQKTILDEEMESLNIYGVSVSNIPDSFQETRSDLFQALVKYNVITD